MGKLQIARGLSLEMDAITGRFAFLARTGAGKTYCAGVLVEEMLKVGAQVVILDPVNKWWGLRLAANGRDKGFDIPVLGGPHGDVPLAPEAGDLIAHLVVDEGISCILDLSDFETDAEQRRFVTAFAKKLYRLKRRQNPPTPMHLVLEEAEEFIPQDQYKDQAQMIGAVKKLLKLGRNFGIGATLVSQRSADVNKKGLSQIGTLVALQTTSPHDRKAIKEWAHGVGDDDSLEKRVGSILPNLKVGEALFWSPGQGIVKKIKFRKKETFDSSATPKGKKKRKGLKVKSLNAKKLTALSKAMADVVEEKKENDPKLLKQRIKQLERELKKAQTGPAKEVVREVQVPVTVVTPQEVEALKVHTLAIAQECASITKITVSADKALKRVQKGQMPFSRQPPRPTAPKRLTNVGTNIPKNIPTVSVPSNGEVKIKRGARRMLAAVATSSNGSVSRTQLGVLSQFKTSGGTFQDYLSVLRRTGLVNVSGKKVTITAEGQTYLGDDLPDVPTSAEEMLALWGPKLKKGARTMLQLLVDSYPTSMSRDELGERAGYTPSGGTFQDYLSVLRRNNLVVVDGAEITASEDMFPWPGASRCQR